MTKKAKQKPNWSQVDHELFQHFSGEVCGAACGWLGDAVMLCSVEEFKRREQMFCSEAECLEFVTVLHALEFKCHQRGLRATEQALKDVAMLVGSLRVLHKMVTISEP